MDAITVQILRNKVASLVDEMHYHFYRSGYSTIIRESTGSVRRVHSPVLNSRLSQAEPLNSRQIHYEGSRDPPGTTSLWTATLCFAGRGLVDVDAPRRR
jgi:hypothetical protein